jgi:uncharacterized protein YecE (DUF72 family)
VANKGTIRLGIAGWVFAPWRGGMFYPKDLKQKEELHYASRHLGVIEINATFRALQKPPSFRKWAAETPEGFVFSIKGHQGITHFKRLKDVDTAVASFIASGPLALGSRLGPFVWQLPPNLKYEREKFEAFFALLPKTPDEAVALAKKHDGLKDPHLTAEGVETIRHAVEVRNESFAAPEFIDLCRTNNIAVVTADTAEWPTMDATADFTYARLQGAPGSDHYEPADLDLWAKRIDAQASGKPVPEVKLVAKAIDKSRDVFALFVSTDKEHAPQNAQAVMKRLGLSPAA